jgi:hypothetical protein
MEATRNIAQPSTDIELRLRPVLVIYNYRRLLSRASNFHTSSRYKGTWLAYRAIVLVLLDKIVSLLFPIWKESHPGRAHAGRVRSGHTRDEDHIGERKRALTHAQYIVLKRWIPIDNQEAEGALRAERNAGRTN